MQRLTMSSLRFMRRDSSRLRWSGPRPGPIASTVTEHRRFPGTSWPEWSPPAAMARRELSVGQRVFGLADWHRDGTLAEYVAIEARNLAPLPGDVDFTVGASLPISGLTVWQGLFEHGRLQAGQSVLAHGAAGAVGTMVTQLAREAGAYVIGTGRAADRQKALDFGVEEFVDLDNDALEDVGGVDLVFDVIGGDIQTRSSSLIRAGGTLVSVVGPPRRGPPTAWRSTSSSSPIVPN